jgi:hypothetical protein
MGLLGTIGGLAGNYFGGPIGGVVGGALGGALEGGSSSQMGSGIGSGLQAAGGAMSAEQARAANQNYANQFGAAQNLVGGAASFRPVGITTRFGSSNFTYNPQTGQMESAGYSPSAGVDWAQGQFQNLAQSGINQAGAAQQQFAPLTTGAQGLMNLGNQYIAQNPNDVAAKYIQNQQNLLAPSRDVANANLQNQLQNTGRTGLSVAQGGNLGQANPEAQALANAQAMQDLQLAAQGQQMGQQNTLFGANLLGQGAGALGNYYAGQSAAYQPYQSAFGAMTGLENLAQQPLSLSAGLGQQAATAGANAGRNYLTGLGLGASYGTSNAATVSPGGTFLSGIAPSLGQGIGSWLGGLNNNVPSQDVYDAMNNANAGSFSF